MREGFPLKFVTPPTYVFIIRRHPEIDFDAAKKLYRDIKKKKDFWLEEIFHPFEYHREPSNCQRAVVALSCLSKMYLEQRKYQKSLGVTDLLTEILECYRIQVFENNRLFSLVGQPHPYAKTRYYSLQHGYHIDCYNAAGVLGIRDKAVESCRKCAELEQLIQDLPSKVIIPFLEPVFGPLTISRLRNEITDDQLWNRISEAMAMFSLASLVNLGTKMCPICLSMENLTVCCCGAAAYCFYAPVRPLGTA
mmetsp:Transcript_29839/g.50794  ORF Transcript_29839/g.50794 Transcript_29839/m.50794 type:complete len:250 (+) Transcript_29839:996-1745(+)